MKVYDDLVLHVIIWHSGYILCSPKDHVKLSAVVRTTAREESQVCKVAEVSIPPDRDSLGNSSCSFNRGSTRKGFKVEGCLLCRVEGLACRKCGSLIEAGLEIIVPNKQGLVTPSVIGENLGTQDMDTDQFRKLSSSCQSAVIMKNCDIVFNRLKLWLIKRTCGVK